MSKVMSITQAGESGTDAAVLAKMNEWTHSRMTVLNREILEGRAPPSMLVKELNDGPLRMAPLPESISPMAARQLMTMVGMYGSSVGRHYQEACPALKETPSKPQEELVATELALPFREYVRRVAERTESGHQPKDAFASLVRWNVPSSRLVWEGQELASIRGYFPDSTRTYTGAEGEATLFKLLKKAETFEAAANDIRAEATRAALPRGRTPGTAAPGRGHPRAPDVIGGALEQSGVSACLTSSAGPTTAPRSTNLSRCAPGWPLH
jgi:hypothetical protein